MKKIKTMLAMMLAMVAFCGVMTSCGDDDDETVAAAKEVVGTYVDNLEMTVMTSTSTYENAEVKVEYADDSHVNITLPGAGSGSMTLPSITVPKVDISGSNGSYTLSLNNYSGTVSVNGVDKNYTVTISGTYSNNVLELNYSLQYGAMPMPMIGKFKATKK